MTTTRTVPPDADLTGAWQLDQPLPVDATVYTKPALLGSDAAAYLVADSAAPFAATVLELPALPVMLGEIELVGFDAIAYDNGAYSNTGDIPIPTVSGGILAGDLIEVASYTAASPSTNKPTVNTSGFVELYDHPPTSAWLPRVTLFYKIATGGETGTVEVEHAAYTTRWGGLSRVWRNVDSTTPYDGVSPVSLNGYGQTPNPLAVTPASDGAVVVVTAAGNRLGGTYPATPSAGYTKATDTSDEDRSVLDQYKTVTTGGVAEDPGAMAWNMEQWTVVTHALRPAPATTVGLIVITSASDETETAALTSGVELPAQNAKQRIQSQETSGTFTLTYAGQTTAGIAFNATAAAVDSALEALSNIGSGDVSVTGGPLDADAVVVEFTGALAATDVSLITSGDDLIISETQRGRAQEVFTKRTDINVPRTGDAYEPQMHVWYLEPVDYTAGDPVFTTFADHTTLHSYAAVLLVYEKVVAGNFIESLGTETNGGSAATAGWGSITPGTAGSVVLAVFAKALNGTWSAAPSGPSSPSGYTVVAEALGVGSTLTVFESPPLPSDVEMPSSISWNGSQDWAAGLFSLEPAVSSGGGALFAAVAALGDEDTYLELAGAAGDLYEVLELDLGSVPSDAVIVGAKIRFAHAGSTNSLLRVALVGINDAGTAIVAGTEHQPGYAPSSLTLSETVVTAQWTELSDGSRPYDYDRLGVALFSRSASPGVTTHKLYWLEAEIEYEEGGPVVSNVVGPASPGDPLTWDYSSSSALPQIAYEVMVVRGSGEDPLDAVYGANPMSPANGDIVYYSGKVYDTSARSLLITDAPLARDTNTFAVRSWARLGTGDEIPSQWVTTTVDIAGTYPAAPDQTNNPVWNPALGGVDLTVLTSTSTEVTRAWILRSIDSGDTFRVATDIGPIACTPSTVIVVSDYYCPLASNLLQWHVVFDSGPMTETSPSTRIGAYYDTFTATEAWYLMVPSDPSMNLLIDVAEQSLAVPHRTQIAEYAGASLVATSEPLGARLSLTIRTREAWQRDKLDALLYSGLRLRLVNILGDEWWVRVVNTVSPDLQRWRPRSSDLTPLRDAYLTTAEFVEVTGPRAPGGPVFAGAVPATQFFRVVDGRLVTSDDVEFVSAGLNGGLPMRTGYAFAGAADTIIAWAYDRYPAFTFYTDVWPGDANEVAAEEVFPGGLLNGGMYWDQTTSAFVLLPDRAYALTGVRTSAAVTGGIAAPDDHWNCRIWRVNAHLRDGPNTWNGVTLTSADTVPQFVARARELLDLNAELVVALEWHDVTAIIGETDFAVPPELIADPFLGAETFTDSPLRDALRFYDAAAAEFDGTTDPLLIGLPNEFDKEGRGTAYDDVVVTLIRRIRAAGYTGVITVPLPRWCGDLAALARGDLDTLSDRLESHGVGANLVWEWHNYGVWYPTPGSGTPVTQTWSEVDAALTACRNGVAGSGRKYAVWMSEYGQRTPVEVGTDEREGVLVMATATYGQALAVKHPHICATWWSTADNTWDSSFALTYGEANKGNESGPDPNSTGDNPGTYPWWDVTSTALRDEWLTPGGRAHWDIAHAIA